MKDVYKVSISFWEVPLPEITFVRASSCSDVIKWAEKKVSSFYEELKNYHIIVDSIIIDTMTEDDLLLIDPEDVLEI